jgi:hypothetical protein
MKDDVFIRNRKCPGLINLQSGIPVADPFHPDGMFAGFHLRGRIHAKGGPGLT